MHEPSKLVENLPHLHILPQSKTKTQITVLKSVGFSVWKYIVFTFCWHSIEASVAFAVLVSRLVGGASSFTEATLIEIGVYLLPVLWGSLSLLSKVSNGAFRLKEEGPWNYISTRYSPFGVSEIVRRNCTWLEEPGVFISCFSCCNPNFIHGLLSL